MPTPVSTLARQLAPISQKTPAVPNPRVSAGVGVVQSVNTDNSVNVLFNGSIVPVNPATSTIPNIGTSVLIMTLGTQWWALGASLIAGGGGTVETGFAPLDSPVFTGIPEAPTAAQGTDTTQIATTEFVMTAITAATETTIGMDAGQESTIRTESVSQLAPPTSSFNMNTQALVNIGAMTVFDGTGANGSIGFSTNPAKIGIQAVNGDSSAILAFGSLFGNGAISFGGPPRITNSRGSDDAALPDVYIYRNNPGSIFCPGDFVHGGGWTLGTNPAAFALYRTQGDAQFFLGMGSLFGQSWLGLGPGGSGICDVQLFRAPSGPCVAAWQLGNQNVGPGTMTWWDGVASDGMVQVGFQTAKVAVLQNSTDTNACIALGATGFGGGILLGAGGTSPTDVQLYHLGTATGVWRLNQMNWWDGNTSDGEIRVNFDSANHVPSISVLHTYGDSQAVVAIGSVLGSGAVQLGGGGSAPPDITLARIGVGQAEWLLNSVQWWDQTTNDPQLNLNVAAGPLFSFFKQNTDTNPSVMLGNLFTIPVLYFGGGGGSTPDITFIRNTTATLTLTAPTFNVTTSTMTMLDSTTTDGKAQILVGASGTTRFQLFADSTHTQPTFVVFASVFGQPVMQFGPGGSTGPDVQFNRTGANAGQWSAASMTWYDGTVGHGSFVLTSNPYAASLYLGQTDTQPLIQLSSSSGAPLIKFGVGASSVPDMILQRIGTSSMQWWDATSSHGSVQMQANPGIVRVYADTTHANPVVLLGNVLTVPVLQFGPGGGTGVDVTFARTGTATGQFTSSTMTFQDGTSSHGSVQIISTGGSTQLNLFADTTHANPTIRFIAQALTVPFMQWGPGGSSATDVSLSRSAAGVLSLSTGSLGFTPTAAQTIGAATTISPSSSHVQITAASPVTNTAHPTITAGASGQVISIVNTGANAITLTSDASSVGTQLSLGATTRAIGAKGSLTLIFNTALTRWVEIGFNAGGNG